MIIFSTLAQQCAPAIALDLLAALSAVESGFDPLAVIHGPKREPVATVGHAVAAAVGVTDQGREVGIGITGIGAAKLAAVGISLSDAFEPCRNLAAAQVVIEVTYRAAGHRGLKGPAADRYVIRSWWRADGRYPSADTYSEAVERERAKANDHLKHFVRGAREPDKATAPSANTEKASPPSSLAAEATTPSTRALPSTREPAASWDVFGQSRGTAVLLYSTNTQRDSQ